MSAEKTYQYMKAHGEKGIEIIDEINENTKRVSEFAFE